jgi:hypothetical protein
MRLERNVSELTNFLRRRYPDWQGFDHPRFVADEVSYKQATAAKARTLINADELDRLLDDAAYDEIINRLAIISKDNNMLWRRAPRKGDTAILYRPALDRPEFCRQMRDLLHGERPSPERLEAFTQYSRSHGLPLRWTFATYFLFICRPQTEMFVKPRTAAWFLKFMGVSERLPSQPAAAAYHVILEKAQALFQALAPYRPHDMIDVQSFIWVAFRESQAQTAGLNLKGQVELGIPPDEPVTVYRPVSGGHTLREAAGSALADSLSLQTLAEQTGLPEEKGAEWVTAVTRKRQAIFYGPPGTGKTFMAEQLARYLIAGDDGFYDVVQFHPAYSYEDFVQGIRPQNRPDGSLSYNLVPGRFLEFCREAEGRNGRCVLIIDEINRANLSRVFGELMYLLEYREQKVALAGGGVFQIPANVYLIGAMNTADRSIALVDYALRRRFAFIPLFPNYHVLRHYHEQQQTNFPLDRLIKLLQRLNNQIGDPHYALGVTYFLTPRLNEEIGNIWQMEIEPYLEEYFYDQPDRVAEFRWSRVKEEVRGIGDRGLGIGDQ